MCKKKNSADPLQKIWYNDLFTIDQCQFQAEISPNQFGPVCLNRFLAKPTSDWYLKKSSSEIQWPLVALLEEVKFR